MLQRTYLSSLRAPRLIWYVHIAHRNPANAIRFLEQLRDEMATLTLFPTRHPLAPESRTFRSPLYHVTVWPYRIIYRVTYTTVEIVTVRHGARNPLKP